MGDFWSKSEYISSYTMQNPDIKEYTHISAQEIRDDWNKLGTLKFGTQEYKQLRLDISRKERMFNLQENIT